MLKNDDYYKLIGAKFQIQQLSFNKFNEFNELNNDGERCMGEFMESQERSISTSFGWAMEMHRSTHTFYHH